ncbi:hypothetical protein [Bacillus atrophaeus]|uniref:hypothetical protein n=1 Tax=Bacillus atrophaeus TaxID=1452 RepID=UPI002280151E|nr:hypothetical protein [Bacillus atrophaeus]MCY8465630.1 hypothetical protein [Bacillus atrophaeus]MCY8478792.1 hypothetical protein [Bacillus atrophaeus]
MEQCSWSKDAQRSGSMTTASVSIISSVLDVGLSIHPIRRMQQKVKKLFALRATMKKETAFDLYTKKLKEAQKKLEAAMLQLKEEMSTPHPKISEG